MKLNRQLWLNVFLMFQNLSALVAQDSIPTPSVVIRRVRLHAGGRGAAIHVLIVADVHLRVQRFIYHDIPSLQLASGKRAACNPFPSGSSEASTHVARVCRVDIDARCVESRDDKR